MFTLLTQYVSVTDRHTDIDRMTTEYTVLALCGKNSYVRWYTAYYHSTCMSRYKKEPNILWYLQ